MLAKTLAALFIAAAAASAAPTTVNVAALERSGEMTDMIPVDVLPLERRGQCNHGRCGGRCMPKGAECCPRDGGARKGWCAKGSYCIVKDHWENGRQSFACQPI